MCGKSEKFLNGIEGKEKAVYSMRSNYILLSYKLPYEWKDWPCFFHYKLRVFFNVDHYLCLYSIYLWACLLNFPHLRKSSHLVSLLICLLMSGLCTFCYLVWFCLIKRWAMTCDNSINVTCNGRVSCFREVLIEIHWIWSLRGAHFVNFLGQP